MWKVIRKFCRYTLFATIIIGLCIFFGTLIYELFNNTGWWGIGLLVLGIICAIGLIDIIAEAEWEVDDY